MSHHHPPWAAPAWPLSPPPDDDDDGDDGGNLDAALAGAARWEEAWQAPLAAAPFHNERPPGGQRGLPPAASPHLGRPAFPSDPSAQGPGPSQHHSSLCPPPQCHPHPPPPPPASSDRVVPVSDLPPFLRPAFTDFRYFNLVQSECFDLAYRGGVNCVISAPTGAGKTGILELAVARMLTANAAAPASSSTTPSRAAKAIYLAPSRALIHERLADWRRRFGPMGIKIAELTGDSAAMSEDGESVSASLASADLIAATPEKLDAITRVRGDRRGARFVSDVGLVLVDEVHLLGEGRGATLEVVVSRLRAVGARAELAGHPIASCRFVAVSATIPNIGAVASWLGCPPAGVKVFGEEVRPVPLQLVVRGYPAPPTDFLFERKLTEHLPAVLAEHGGGGRPALIFCASRKGAAETAARLAATGVALPSLPRGAGAELAGAASGLAHRPLAAAVARGVGFHHAGLEPGDRATVEALFAGRLLPVLCATATLAVGVNLPAYLVVLKGTRRWAGAGAGAGGQNGGGGASGGPPAAASTPTPGGGGFDEYDRSAVLQMCGRAGRPQFDSSGVAVIMTSTASAPRYRALAGGGEPLESALAPVIAEALNAEVAGRTVTDLAGAAAWFGSTFLAHRIAAAPAAYGFPPSTPRPALERLAIDRLVIAPLKQLASHGLVRLGGGDNQRQQHNTPNPSLASTEAGSLMARHVVRLGTMVAMLATPPRASLPDLLDIITRAEELVGGSGAGLRRGDKKPLNALNKAAAAVAACGGGASYFVPAPGRPGRPKERITTPAEKLFILINDALAGGGAASEGLEWSLRAEAEGAVRTARRVAACMSRLCEAGRALAATANATRLARALTAGCWDGSAAECRQLPGIGKVMGGRLAAAGLGTLGALRAADGRRVEAVTGRNFPFGAQVAGEVGALAPPPIQIDLRGLRGGGVGGGGVSFEVVVTRVVAEAGGPAVALAAPPAPAPAPARASSTTRYAKLLVGSLHDDALLHTERIDLASFASPYTLRLRARGAGGGGGQGSGNGGPPAAGPGPPRVRVVAATLPERVVGFDVTVVKDVGVLEAVEVVEAGGAEGAAPATAGEVEVAEVGASPPPAARPTVPPPPPPPAAAPAPTLAAAAAPSPLRPAPPTVGETPNPFFEGFRLVATGEGGGGGAAAATASPVPPAPLAARRSTGGGGGDGGGHDTGRTAALRAAGLLSSSEDEREGGGGGGRACTAAATPPSPPLPPDYAEHTLAALKRAGLAGMRASGEVAVAPGGGRRGCRLGGGTAPPPPPSPRRARQALWESDGDDNDALGFM